MTAVRKCLRCQRLGVRPRTGTGRTIAYRVFTDLALPDDVPIADLWQVWCHLL